MTTEIENKLKDTYNRQVTYLRLSVTDRCNLRCCYCAPSRPQPVQLERLLTFDEMLRLVKIGVQLGITKVRLTGGEPLCREGLTEFMEKLSRIPQLKDIGLTTNGVLFSEQAAALKTAGLGRINISLDTLEPSRFKAITGRDAFERVWQGIMGALDMGFDPVKINTVVMNGVNDDEVVALAGLTRQYPLHVRFIEYMPIGTDTAGADRFFLSGAAVRNRLEAQEKLIPVEAGKNDGPARRFRFAHAPGEVGFISSMSDHFCKTCNRMRLTASGGLRPCLLAEDQVDVMTALRNGATDGQVISLFNRALALKQPDHGVDFHGQNTLKTRMVSIGG